VLTFADPLVYARHFGWQFNADMTGEAVMQTAMHNERCAGILVNSALTASSVFINRAAIASRLGSADTGRLQSQRRPWWRFW
jgi:hypothetical protein